MEFGSLPLLLVICILLLSCWEAACSDRNGLLNGEDAVLDWERVCTLDWEVLRCGLVGMRSVKDRE